VQLCRPKRGRLNRDAKCARVRASTTHEIIGLVRLVYLPDLIQLVRPLLMATMVSMTSTD